MKKKIIVVALGMMSLVSCKSQQKQSAGPQETKEQTVYQGVTDSTCAVEVNFGSYAAGIDGEALDKVVKAINDRNLKSSVTPLGREGERRICLPLTELKEREKKAFLEELKKIVKQGQLVSVSVR